ncbi:MAG TPA: helix-turn-helix domain-containing protein [Baekduia sp.]
MLHHDGLNELIERLRADLPAMTDETEAIVHREHPELVARVGATDVRRAIAHTHARFVRILAGDAEPSGGDANVAFGADAAAAGASVEVLMAGYRVGARVGWRRVIRHAGDLRLPGPTTLHVASQSMAFVDELSVNSLEGFAREAEAAQGARARARQALLDALVAGRAAEAEALAGAAAWPVPDRLRVAVVLAADSGRRLDDRVVLRGRADGVPLAIAPAADDDALALVPHAAGPPATPADAPRSLAGARRLAALAHAGVVLQDAPLRWEDHLPALILHADPDAAQALAAARLQPLQDASPARERLLVETLAAWLDHPGRPREIARALQLHHQTVRYRLARLRERLGDALDDPEARFELQLALRVSSPARTRSPTAPAAPAAPAPAPARS